MPLTNNRTPALGGGRGAKSSKWLVPPLEMASSRRAVMTDGKPTWVSLGSLTLKPGCQGQGGEEATRLTRAGLTPSQILSSPEINFFVFF